MADRLGGRPAGRLAGRLGKQTLSLLTANALTFAMLGKDWKADFVTTYGKRCPHHRRKEATDT